MFARRPGARFNRGRVGGAVGVFNPASLALTAWWRGSYGGSPWVGTASAGASGSRNLTEAINPPAVGTAVNGFTPAAADGSNDILQNGTAIGTFLPTAAYFYWVLFYVDTINASSNAALASAFNNEALFSDSGGFIGCSLLTTGTKLQVWNFDTTGKGNEHSISTGAWTLVCARYDGVNIRSRVNSGSILSAASGAYDDGTAGLLVFRNFGVRFANSRILDLGMMASAETDARFTDIKTYVNARYALAL